MKLFFYQNASASEEQRELVNSVCRSVRSEFTELTSQMGESHRHNIDWWVSELAARNIFATPFFSRLCQLAAIARLIEAGHPPSEIVVDSWSLFRTLKKRAKADRRFRSTIRFRLNPRLTLKTIAKPMFNWGSAVILLGLRAAAAAITRGQRHAVPEDATLINVFYYAGAFRDGRFVDRYFGEMLESLSEAEQKKFFYVPAPVRTVNFFRLFRLARCSVQRFCFREDYLNPLDYGYALCFPLRYGRLRLVAPTLHGFDLGDLVRATRWYSLASPSSLEGLLAFRFGRRFCQAEKGPKLVVDWFENQAMNRGMNAGIRWHRPAVPTKGYQGFLNPDMMVSTFPTTLESESRVVPESVAVMGQGWVSPKKEFCPNLGVEVVPAFRYQHVFEAPKGLSSGTLGPVVLVALPIQVDESVEILSLLAKACASLPARSLSILIKPHPHLALERIRPKLRTIEGQSVKWVNGDIESLLEVSSVLVSACSSVCLEAVVLGVPALILRGPDGMAYSPIPKEIPADYWAVCLDEQSLRAALIRFCLSGSKIALSLAERNAFQRRYFAPRNLPVTRRFLGMDPGEG